MSDQFDITPTSTEANPESGNAWTVEDGTGLTAHGALTSPGNYIYNTAAGKILFAGPSMPAATHVESVQAIWTACVGTPPATMRPFLKIGGEYYGGNVSVTADCPTTESPSETWQTNPATEGSWTKTDLDEIEFGVELISSEPSAARVYLLLLRVTYNKAPTGYEPGRDVASRILRPFRRPPPTVVVTGPLWLADLEIGDRLRVADHLGLHVAGSGWGYEDWAAEPLVVLGSQPDPFENRCILTCLLERHYLTRCWDTMRTDERQTTLGEGVPRLDMGSGRTFVRDIQTYLELPSAEEDGVAHIVEYPRDVEGVGYRGTLLQEARTNLITRSSFKSGNTGWGSGSGAGTRTIVQTNLLFDVDVTANAGLMTAGDPHDSDGRWPAPTTASIAADSFVTVSIDHLDDAGAELHLEIVRDVDGWYLTTAGTWQSGATTIALPIRTALDLTQRDVVGPFDVGPSATTITITAVQPSGGTTSRKNQIYHLQLEVGRWASSRIVCDGAAETRAADNLTRENNTGEEVILADRGTIRPLTWIPLFDEDDIPDGTSMFLVLAYWDANNSIRLSYERAGGASTLLYRVRAGGSNTDASVACSAKPGVPVTAAGRWTSDAGELGLPDFTASVFADGVKGTDASGAAAPTPTSPATVYIGQDESNANQANGWLANLDVSPYCLHDDEIAGDA